MTCAHCVCLKDSNTLDDIYKKAYLVFKFTTKKNGNYRTKIKSKYVREIVDVISHKYVYKDYTNNDTKEYKVIESKDWAWVRLNQKVDDEIEPLIPDYDPIALNDEVYMLGHPMGITLKFSRGALVKKIGHNDYFQADLNGLAGNSGSPIFNKIGKVVGIFFRGYDDFALIENYKGVNGQTRVKIKRMTKEEIAKGLFPSCHRMSKIDFLLPSKIAWVGQIERIELLKKHIQSLQRNSTAAGVFSHIMAFSSVGGAIAIGIVATPLAGIAAYFASGIVTTPTVMGSIIYGSEVEKKAISDDPIIKSMSAYNINLDEATELVKIEKTFDYEFSPRKILDLLRYAKSQNLKISEREKREILRSMHKIDDKKKLPSIPESRIKAITVIEKKKTAYANIANEIERIASYVVSQSRRNISFEAARIELKIDI